MGNGFGGIQGASIGRGTHARAAHLALVQGGGPSVDTTTAATGASSIARPANITQRPVAAPANTGYSHGSDRQQRSQHEQGVRAVARRYDNFEEALLPMVIASGVGSETAATVAEAIRSNPALSAQAERAFQRARIDAV